MPDEKQPEVAPISFKVTQLARQILERLAKSEGVNMTAYLEVTLRRLAREKGWAVDDEEQKKESEAG